MNKFVCAAVGCIFVAAVTPNTASAVIVVHPTPALGASSTAGAAATGGFLGFVAFLATYDFVRRTTCIGDPLALGGPGFSEPMPAVGNIIPPKCPLFKKGKGRKH